MTTIKSTAITTEIIIRRFKDEVIKKEIVRSTYQATQAYRKELEHLYRILVSLHQQVLRLVEWYDTKYPEPRPDCDHTFLCVCERRTCNGRTVSSRTYAKRMKAGL